MSCFSGLLSGKRKASSKGKNKGVYAKKATGNDCPKVKPVEFMDMPADDTVVVDVVNGRWCRDSSSVPASACNSNFAVHPAAELARQPTGEDGDKTAVVSRDSSAAAANDLVAGVFSSGATSDGTSSSDAKSAEPDDGERSSLGRSMSPTAASPKLMRSCSNIETTMPTLLLPSPGKEEEGGAGAAHQHDGYTSDTLGSVTAADAKNKGVAVEVGPIPNQWIAFSFSAEASPLDRVSAWVNSVGNGAFHAVDEGDDDATGHGGGGDARPRCSEIVELSPAAAGGKRHPKRRAADEAAQVSGIVQTLNTFSSVAHIAGMGLKAVPTIAAFSNLRAVNLSGNMIVQISAGSLPKGLHSLDLSRNKIAIIEGLRELTRLRVLNLSYNRISRIGHGLSSCVAIRELYLAGNKISEVEGLHRLLKLAVLDVSFNKITTAKSLGQLVANYGSLRAINLLGNPVQANTGDDTLRKAVSGLLPRIEYLNKQAVKPQRAREVAKDSVAQAALGNAGWNSRRRLTRRLSQSMAGSSAGKGRGRDGNGSRRATRSKSMTRSQTQSPSLPRR